MKKLAPMLEKHFSCSTQMIMHFYLLIESKKGGKDQETIRTSTTPESGYHMGK